MKTKKFSVGTPVLILHEQIPAEIVASFDGSNAYCLITEDKRIYDVHEESLIENTVRERRYITKKLFVERVKDLYESYMKEGDWEKLENTIPTQFLDDYARSIAEYRMVDIYYAAKAAICGIFSSLSRQHDHIHDSRFKKLKALAKRLICVGV